MYYPDDLVEEIRLRNDIVDVIGSYVHLKRSGSNYTGLCPFHTEKTPSFSVSGQRQIFKCFGCGIGGNVYTFLMNYENYTFQEAIQALAVRAGITIPENEYSHADKALKEKKEQIYKINKEAAKFYYTQLFSPYGEKGHEYLNGRGLTDDTIKSFGLGFAVPGTNALYSYLKSLPDNFSDDALKESGIFTFSEKYGVKDKFWNRVIFPIMDINNKVIAFGGRVMAKGAYEDGDKKIPKYLNSTETVIFEKGKNLYGLNIAKRSRRDFFIICEGYIDVISLHQAGFDMAVASLGTALTSMQATMLKRYKEKIYLTYDSDQAGITAALRAIPILKSVELSVRVIDLSPYKDPDELIKNLGEEEFENRIKNAEGSFFYEIRQLERDYDLDDPESKTKFCIEIANKISRFDDELERNNYTHAISDKYKLEEESLVKLIKKQAMKTENIPEYVRPKSGIAEKKADKVDEAGRITQRTLLTWVYEEPKDYDIVKRYISSEDFSDEVYRQAAALLFEQIENSEINIAKIISCFTDVDEQQKVSELFLTKPDDIEEGKQEALKMLIIKVMELSLERVQNTSDGDMDSIMYIRNRRKEIQELKKGSNW